MVQEDNNGAQKKEALKNLREARKQTIAAVSASVKEQRKATAAIKAELQQGERTVPEIAAATGLPSAEVLWFVATLKKYGEVSEAMPAGSYYRYRLVQPVAAETEPGSSEHVG
jgi:predicted Rossmann fold nucleotide-binding protein DprA/Smf involved in DNA uptake